jgi:electron transport complex protein RnfG
MRDTIRLSFVLGIICIISALVLSGMYSLTRDRIEEANARKIEEALAQVLPGQNSFKVFEALGSALDGGLGSVTEVYLASGEDSGSIAAKAAPAGYGGPIEMVVGITPDGAVGGVRIISQSETPGLGAEVTRVAFTGQFEGRSAPESIKVKQDGGSIDAVTGATISSRAVTRGVSDVLDVFRRLGALGVLTGGSSTAGEEGQN